MELTLTDANFEQEVLQSRIPVLVDFWAAWCVDPEARVALRNNLQVVAGDLLKGAEVFGFTGKVDKGIVSNSMVVSDAGHCRLVRTESGREIKVTDDHLFYTPLGWRKAEELKEGDKVAILPLDDPIDFIVRRKLLVSEDNIKRMAFPKMRTEFYIEELSQKNLLPFFQDNPKILILTRLIGACFTDGNLYQGKNNLREVSFFLGSKSDVEMVASDLKKIGFSKIHKSFRETPGQIGRRKFVNRSFRIKVLSTSLWLLLRSLGVPEGNKTHKSYFLPNWLMEAPLAIKKEFLAAFLGGDGPRVSIRLQERKKKKPYNKLSINDLEFHKSKAFVSSGVRLARQLRILFEEFGIRVPRIFTEEDKYRRKDGSRSVIIHLKFANDFVTGLAVSQSVGYRYCGDKQFSAMHVGEFLRLIQEKKKRWKELYQRVLAEARKGLGYRRISRKFEIPPLLAFNWIKGKDRATSPKHFLKFTSWLKEVTNGLGEGFMWSQVSQVKPVFLPSVARITVEKTHNFIANGFLVHNCGPCQMIGPIVEELAKDYDGKLKVGKMNVDENQVTPGKYNIMSIPSLLIFKGGEVVKTMIGVQSKEGFKKQINEILR